MKYRMGVDFDGILNKEHERNIILDRNIPFVIVTGRTPDRYKETIDELNKYGISAPIYFYYGTDESLWGAIMWKRLIINKLDLRYFYEDDIRIANYLSKNCPGCKIYHLTRK